MKLKKPNMRVMLNAIATILESPRDRLGRLDLTAKDSSRTACEVIRVLAVEQCLAPCADKLEQCARLARIALS